VVPLASNDLFGGVHLGQRAERIQAAQSCKLVGSRSIRNHVAHFKETRSDWTNPTRFARWSKGTKPRNPRQAQLFSRARFRVDFSDNQTFNVVGL
jgi:hypothetical protein